MRDGRRIACAYRPARARWMIGCYFEGLDLSLLEVSLFTERMRRRKRKRRRTGVKMTQVLH